MSRTAPVALLAVAAGIVALAAIALRAGATLALAVGVWDPALEQVDEPASAQLR